MFDAVVVISLARRPDRLAAFYERLPAELPFPRPTAFAAIDGTAEPPPKDWRTTPGAWGCYRSHQDVIDYAWASGVERLLVFEDDATFMPDFTARLAALKVPADCDQLYLGGQHLAKPEAVAPGIVRGQNVNRTHAYALLGRPALELVREHLRPGPHWTSRQHVDHHLGILHRERRINVYAVSPWLCGQAAGLSDVDGRKRPERAWR